MILVTGASGHVGAELAKVLAATDSQRVRAMSRNPESLQVPTHVERVYGDARDETSLQAAFRGVTSAFLMSAEPTSTEPPTHVPRLVNAAVRADVEHVVLLSVYSGGTGNDVIADFWRRIEDAVTGSGLHWTLLRPGRFMSNALQWAPQIQRGQEVNIAFAERPTASIDPRDVAAVASKALIGEQHHGATYQLSGLEVLTPIQELAILAQLLDRPLRHAEPPLDVLRAGLSRSGMPNAVIDAILARTLSNTGTEILPTVERLLGRPPKSFSDWARDHLERFDRGSGSHFG